MDYRNRSLRRKIMLLRNALPSKPVAEMSQKRRRIAPNFACPHSARSATCSFHRQEMVASTSDNDPASCAKQPHSTPN
jgi:hypothetical protein